MSAQNAPPDRYIVADAFLEALAEVPDPQRFKYPRRAAVHALQLTSDP